MSSTIQSLLPVQSPPHELPSRDPSASKPIVIGVYGLPGSGKTTLVDGCNEFEDFIGFDGSQIIGEFAGDIAAFKQLSNDGKLLVREAAIRKVAQECGAAGKAGVVAGHLMFWEEMDPQATSVLTPADLETYTHMIYLDLPPHIIKQRQEEDRALDKRDRPEYSLEHIAKWQKKEEHWLRKKCLQHKILYSRIVEADTIQPFNDRIFYFLDSAGSGPWEDAQRMLDSAVASSEGVGSSNATTMFVLDADKTLTAEDTGKRFWNLEKLQTGPNPVERVLGSLMGYSHDAFVQCALAYSEVTGDDFNNICEIVASNVKLYPEFVELLQRISYDDHAGAILITCGLAQVWRNVLRYAGFADQVAVLGAGRFGDELIITPQVKKQLVERLQKEHNRCVIAIGDSVIDLPMLQQADEAIVIVGSEDTRSKSMERALKDAIDGGLRASQVLLPSYVSPRLDKKQLPVIELEFDKLMNRFPARSWFTHATDTAAAKLLMTRTRDAVNEGPALRSAHREVGKYLAKAYVAEELGLESYPIPHTTGIPSRGYRLKLESSTLIIPLMRGGEPLAQGISDVFSTASFLHAKVPRDVTKEHIHAASAVVLVDSVVNTGESIVSFIEHIRGIASRVKICVVAEVVQKQAYEDGGPLDHAKAVYGAFTVVALRVSENKYKGKWGTDTGNRLFNTKHID